MTSEYTTQCDTVLRHLKRYKKQGITSIDSILCYKILRLASRINDLRKLGHNINTTMVQSGRKRYARYTLA